MTTEKEITDLINNIVSRQLKTIEQVANEQNIQVGDPADFLIEEIKRQFGMTLENLQTLYDETINTPECTLGIALKYVPLFTVFGLLNAAQLGVTQEEYYMIVDHYIINKFNLVEEG